MTRVLAVIGTRPEAIKMSPIVLRLAAEPGFETIVCATAQHRDLLDSALALFLRDVRTASHRLDIEHCRAGRREDLAAVIEHRARGSQAEAKPSTSGPTWIST